MQKILSTITISCLALGLSAAGTFAGEKAMKTEKTAATTAETTTTTKKAFKSNLVRSSKLIGADLFNTTGEDIGQVNDLVFDERSGAMTHVILAAGGFLGVGDKLTPVTWQSVKVKPHDQGDLNFVTTFDKERLARERSFDQKRLHDDWMKQLPDTNRKFVRASTVDDAKLFDRNGQHIGAITEVVMDTKTGKAAYAVVDFEESFLDKRDQMTMIPWTLIRQSEKASPGFVLHTDKTKLEGATFFTKDTWPNMNDLAWNKQVYDHYAVSPYYWTGA